MNSERSEQVRYFGFAAFVGILLLLNLTGYFTSVLGLDTAAIIAVLAGYRIFFNSIKALFEKEISADLAICIAVIAALAVGQYTAAAEAMFIMLVGEGLEAYAAGHTSAAIRRFVEQMPRRARRVRNGVEEDIETGSLVEGDTILVRAGERIPADGVVLSGNSSVDESSITGESLPREKESGQEVFSGTLNGNGLLTIQVTRAGEETTLSRVAALVEKAREQRAPVERLADRYARYFLPALLIAAALTFYFTRDWLRTVAVLIVACPCALILATPTAMVAAIGGLARRGILVRGGTVLQQAARIDTVLWDKTGTITSGQFEILRVMPVRGTAAQLMEDAAAAESGSDHPLARVILAEAQRQGLKLPVVEHSQTYPGRGTECLTNGRTIRAGSAAFLAENGRQAADALVEEIDRMGATAIFVADQQGLLGAILLRDRIREGAKAAVDGLKDLDVNWQVMLTGDRKQAAEVIAREAAIPAAESNLLPEQKLDRVVQLTSQGRFVAMVGDGVNDAPALAAAHVGIAVSGASDVTAEAADVVYLGHSLENLPALFTVSRRAVATAWQNIFLFAGLVNVLAVALAATGILTPIYAAATHQLSSFFVMINSLRLLRVERTGADRQTGWFARTLARTPLPAAWTWVLKIADWIDVRSAFVFAVERWRLWIRPALIATSAAILLSGIHMIGPSDVGIVERFGHRLTPDELPGLHYKLPWPIDQLTRLQAKRIRVVEIGFRSGVARGGNEPMTYEWNVQHRSGRFQSKPEESLALAGDQNMMEVNAVVHFRVTRPEQFLLRQLDGESTVRSAAEGSLTAIATTTSLDEILTSGRKQVEARVKSDLQTRLDRYAAGVEVLHVQLLDVHPSGEVVDAFREVSAAYEEKNRLINEAEGYRNEQVAVSRGNAKALVASAEGYSLGKKNRAQGDASRFTQREEGYRTHPGLTRTRLYLETMEQVLPGKNKMIIDSNKGRRHLILLEDGVEIAPPGVAVSAPNAPRIPIE